MADAPTTPQTPNQDIVIKLSPEALFSLKIMEFDKNIATAEAQVSDLKKQKATYIYDISVKGIMDNYQSQQNQQPK